MTHAAPSAPLDGFDPGPEIRASVATHALYRARLRAAARELARFARDVPGERIERDLDARLAPLRTALWRSPFYREVFHRRGLSPEDLRRLADLPHFPLLERRALRDHFADVPALDAGAPGPLLVEHSSGSTGQPVPVLKDEYDTVHPWAVLFFWLSWLGRPWPRRPRVALLCSLPHGVEYTTRLPALGGGTLSRISLARAAPADRLRGFDPHVVFSDPAGLHWLSSVERRPRPLVVLSSALHLSPVLRRAVEAALGAPVVNYYSTSETGPLAWECTRASGRFHVLHPDVWVESVGGELVVTRLRESVLPLLRYRTGDGGEVVPEACVCGYRGRSITAFNGRRACLFLTPAGEPVDAWRLAWVLRHDPLDGFRLIQEGPAAFVLETRGGARSRLVSRLEDALRSLGWDAPRVTVRALRPDSERARTKPEPFVAPRRAEPPGRQEVNP